MKISTQLVEKLTISDVEHLDPINVIFEDYGPKRGKVTIEVYGDAWSYFWSNTGRETIKEFFATAGEDYLVSKLSIGINPTVDDDSSESLQKAAKAYILKDRREGNISKYVAKERWWTAENLSDGIHENAEDLQEIFGDEWYYDIPQRPNVKYNHLLRIVKTIQQAIALQNV